METPDVFCLAVGTSGNVLRDGSLNNLCMIPTNLFHYPYYRVSDCGYDGHKMDYVDQCPTQCRHPTSRRYLDENLYEVEEIAIYHHIRSTRTGGLEAPLKIIKGCEWVRSSWIIVRHQLLSDSTTEQFCYNMVLTCQPLSDAGKNRARNRMWREQTASTIRFTVGSLWNCSFENAWNKRILSILSIPGNLIDMKHKMIWIHLNAVTRRANSQMLSK